MIMAKKNVCGLCHRKGRRECPVLAGLVCAACCGANRGSELDCPPECTHFPFGTRAYDLWLRIDGTWFPRALEYILNHVGKGSFEEMIGRLSVKREVDCDDSLEAGVTNAVHYYLGVHTDDTGRTLGEQWEEEEWAGLNNDERVMITHRRHTWPAIIEVQRVLDEQSLECTDVLDPERGSFLLFDRSTAARAVRFSRYLIWLTHYPYFSRVAGSGVEVPNHIHEHFIEELRRRIPRKERRRPGQAIRRYLAENFAECCGLLEDVSLEYRERMFRSMDVDHCRAWYELRAAKARIKKVIEAKPDFEADRGRELEPDDPPGAEYYLWLRRGQAKAFEEGMPSMFQHSDDTDGVGTLGTLRLADDDLMIETFGRKKFNFAKKLITRYFGRNLKLSDEKVVDLVEKVLNREDTGPTVSAPQPAVPPDVHKEVVEQFHRRHYETFLDDEVPMLEGMSPRQAAADPAMRPRLIELMKLHVHGLEKRSRDEGMDLSIDWLLDELGLQELR